LKHLFRAVALGDAPKGGRLCRPPERMIDLLPPQRGEFFKEDGMRIVDEKGRRVATT